MGKKKKEKIVYVDDGHTIADMSGVQGMGFQKNPDRPKANWKERWTTYKAAVKMMFGPMLVVICGIIILYMLLHLVFILL